MRLWSGGIHKAEAKPPMMNKMEVPLEEQKSQLLKTLYRLIRFNRALIVMGAIETKEALEEELKIAFDVYYKFNN